MKRKKGFYEGRNNTEFWDPPLGKFKDKFILEEGLCYKHIFKDSEKDGIDLGYASGYLGGYHGY